MPNPYGALEITAREVKTQLDADAPLVLLDVREPNEYALAALTDARVVYAPLSVLAQRQLEALPAAASDPDATIVVFCHHGVRSAQVTAWLRGQGWRSVLNLAGGIHAWAHEIDPTVGKY